MTTVATLNIGDGSDANKARALSQLVKHGAVAIALQEAGDRRELLNEFCRRANWRAWFGDGSPGAASVPILWNPREIVAVYRITTPATDSTYVGDKGAGPSRMKAKVWNRVRFNALDARFVFINGHIVPSVYLPARRRLAKQQIATLADVVERRRAPVVAVGDFNMRPTDRLLKPLRELGMHQHTHAPTHGRRTIDLTWTLGIDGRAEVVKVPSDHRAVLLDLR